MYLCVTQSYGYLFGDVEMKFKQTATIRLWL